MHTKVIAPTLQDVEDAKFDHDAALAELDATRVGTYDRMAAAQKAESAHRHQIRVASAYWNALAGETTEDTIERRVYRAADVLADAGMYAGRSPSDLAWGLEEAGLLR